MAETFVEMESDPGIRRATQKDIPHLTYFRLEAQDGINEALFENLDISVEEIIDREMNDSQSFESYRNYWVTETEGRVSGGMQAFPFDLLDIQGYNPIIPKERLYIEEAFEDLTAPGSYYIHALAVYPEFTRQGIASRLVNHARDLARENGFEELSLYCLEENPGAVRLYEKYGFKSIGTRPMPAHPKIKHGGNILLMVTPTSGDIQVL